MILRFAPLLLALLLAGCSRSPDGVYQSVGSEEKFRMTLELAYGGKAKFTTKANLGDAKLDRSVEASMSLPTAVWKQDAAAIVVTGNGPDGKPMVYRFARQKNGDLVWDRNGARLVRSK